MIGFFLFALLSCAVTNYLIREEPGIRRALLAAAGGLFVGIAVSVIVGSVSLGQLGISINGAIATPIGVAGVLGATWRERQRQRQREQKQSPTDLRSR